jgi:hypothetical protein
MDNADLGPAMAQAHARDTANEAKNKVEMLERRIEALEKLILQHDRTIRGMQNAIASIDSDLRNA